MENLLKEANELLEETWSTPYFYLLKRGIELQDEEGLRVVINLTHEWIEQSDLQD